MDSKINQNVQEHDTVKRDPKWEALRRFPHGVEDYWHKNQGPWPQPAPDNPVRQMAEVIHLPEEEVEDWNTNVGKKLIWYFLFGIPSAMKYFFTHKNYKNFSDSDFQKELTEGLYSKFMTPLDEGDWELFKKHVSGSESDYVKADFSCMESIAPNCNKGMWAAPTMTLIEKKLIDNDNFEYIPRVIYLYQVDENIIDKTFSYKETEKHFFTKEDSDNWELAKYFVLQGAVHRVNLTEHALLHFPFDSINAITKSILPKSHLLFQLLIPHLRLSLGVNRAVLENPGSLINRDHQKFYSPFCAEGIHIRKLLPDGYVGRDGKPKAYPKYNFPFEPKIPDSDFGKHLQAYYDEFAKFVPKVMVQIEDKDEESWLYIGLWADCIEEWMPGFPKSEDLIDSDNGNKPKQGAREKLNKIITMIMWDLSIAHATDHIAIHNKRPEGNPFRLRVPAPKKGSQPEPDWRDKMVTRKDLITYWFTDLFFYKPHNVTVLKDVEYPFSVPKNPEKDAFLRKENEKFRKALQDCEDKLKHDGVKIPARLDQISTSLQY